jgi:acetyl-CoA synthetase
VASVKAVITITEPDITAALQEALPACPTISAVAYISSEPHAAALEPVFTPPADWSDFNQLTAAISDERASALRTEAPPAGGEDPMLIYFTSGTTAMPKMVLHDYNHPLGHIITAHYWQGLGADGLHISVADTGWAKCGWGKIYGQWICGVANFVYDMDHFVPAKLLRKIADYQVTSFCAPPTIYRYLIQEDLSQYDLSALQNALTAGEPLNPEVFNRFKEATGLDIREGFGQTEGVVLCANFPYFPARPGSIGKPSPLYQIDIIDEDGESCPAGTEGRIVVRGLDHGLPPGLFRGYYRDEEATRRVWHDNLYETGDIAWRDEDGYYWFVGRSDDVIKCSGYRIGPFEVESALQEHPAVLECAVTAAPDPMRGQVVKATIVLTKGFEPSPALIHELQDHVKQITAPYKYPRIIEFVNELPKTISGKIRRGEIRQRDSQPHD